MDGCLYSAFLLYLDTKLFMQHVSFIRPHTFSGDVSGVQYLARCGSQTGIEPPAPPPELQCVHIIVKCHLLRDMLCYASSEHDFATKSHATPTVQDFS